MPSIREYPWRGRDRRYRGRRCRCIERMTGMWTPRWWSRRTAFGRLPAPRLWTGDDALRSPTNGGPPGSYSAGVADALIMRCERQPMRSRGWDDQPVGRIAVKTSR